MTIFHLIMLILCLPMDKFSKIVNNGLWFPKLIMISLLYYISLKLKFSFFEKYFFLASLLSPAVIITMTIWAMDLFYIWSSVWAKKYFEEKNQCYGVLLIIFTVGALLLSFLLIGLGIMSSCNWIWSIPYILAKIIILGLTFAKLNEKANMLTTSLYLCLCSWIFYLASGSSASPSCGERKSKVPKQAQLGFYVIFSLMITLYMSLYNTPEILEQEQIESQKTKQKGYEMTKTTDRTVNLEESRVTDTNLDPEIQKYRGYQHIKFHWFLCILSSFGVVLMTSWKGEKGLEGMRTVDSSTGAVVQGVSAGVGVVLFIWNLVAPYFLPDRTF